LDGKLSGYLFTDVGPSFLAHARQRFGEIEAFKTATFDIGRDPKEQGIPERSFDLIVASNVVHATPDIRRSLRSLRRAIRPGGSLVFGDRGGRNRVADSPVGLLDGWWAFRDPALRGNSPLMSCPQWSRIFREQGFRPAVVPVPADSGLAVLIGTD